MSRLFWLGLGAAAGVLATRRAHRAAQHLTPGGFAEDVGEALRELAVAVGSFGAEVRAGMAERERELHRMVDERTGIVTDGRGDGRADHAYVAGSIDGAEGTGGVAHAAARARRAAN